MGYVNLFSFLFYFIIWIVFILSLFIMFICNNNNEISGGKGNNVFDIIVLWCEGE